MEPCFYFFFNDTATTEIYTLSLHDALPICARHHQLELLVEVLRARVRARVYRAGGAAVRHHERVHHRALRSEEHTSELQSRQYLVCRLLLEKKTSLRTLPSHVAYASLLRPS